MNPAASSGRPSSFQEVYSFAMRMLQSPADLVMQSAKLRDLVQRLPPEPSELLSRPYFERAALVTLCANFFDVPDAVEVPPQTIRAPYDCWIRGVTAIAIPQLNHDTVAGAGLFPTALERAQLVRFGDEFRGLFEVNWKLNGRQGFVSTGISEILAPAPLVTGDGEFACPLDWRLEQNDTIQVRLRSRIDRILPPTCTDPPIERTLPWVAVLFWAVDTSEGGKRSG